VLLAASGIVGIDVRVWARWLGALLFGATILLVGLVLRRSQPQLPGIALLGALLTLGSPDLLAMHTEAMSDPVFLFLGLLGLVLVAVSLEQPNGRRMLLAGAVAVGLAWLERYPGIALVGAGAAGVLLLREGSPRRRLGDAILFTAVSAGPMMIWLLHNLAVAGTATGRHAVYHPAAALRQIDKGMHVLAHWLIPQGGLSGVAGTAVAVMIGGVLVATLWRRYPARTILRRGTALPPVLALFVVIYVPVLIVSFAWFDAGATMDGRLLAPVYVSTLLLTLSLVASRWAQAPLPLVGVAAGLCVVVVGTHLLWTGARVGQYYREGQGYAGSEWRHSSTIGRVKALPKGMRVYSNAPDAVYALTGTTAAWIPPTRNYLTTKPNRSYGEQLAAMGQQIRERRAVLVYFTGMLWRSYMPSAQALRAAFPSLEVEDTGDGLIFKAR
jgi:4-amino-4-deoxy-L-arabinose transferase-like glycosyltransferase